MPCNGPFPVLESLFHDLLEDGSIVKEDRFNVRDGREDFKRHSGRTPPEQVAAEALLLSDGLLVFCISVEDERFPQMADIFAAIS